MLTIGLVKKEGTDYFPEIKITSSEISLKQIAVMMFFLKQGVLAEVLFEKAMEFLTDEQLQKMVRDYENLMMVSSNRSNSILEQSKKSVVENE